MRVILLETVPVKPPLNTVYCVHLEYPIWLFLHREGFKGSKEHTSLSPIFMYYKWRSDSEKQCSAKWKKVGKLFCLLYPLQLCPGTPRGLCYTKLTVQHRVRAGVSSEELTAKQTSQKPLQTASTQKG